MNEHTQTVVAELRDRYAPTAVPPCRICGGGLSLERCGAGSPSVWRCAGRVEGGYAPGRKIADQHYGDSEWTDYKAGGDQRVIDICDALESSERRAAEAEARIAELGALHSVAEAREIRLERELLAIWATVRPGGPAPHAETDVRHAVEARVARLEARLVAMCSCVDYRIHCKGGDTQYCQSGHDHETVGPRKGCKKCGGSGAVILEGGE